MNLEEDALLSIQSKDCHEATLDQNWVRPHVDKLRGLKLLEKNDEILLTGVL